jgi:hypothetical protein
MVSHTAEHFTNPETRGTDGSHDYQTDIVFLNEFTDILYRFSRRDYGSHFDFCALGLALSNVVRHSLSQPVEIHPMNTFILLAFWRMYMKQD